MKKVLHIFFDWMNKPLFLTTHQEKFISDVIKHDGEEQELKTVSEVIIKRYVVRDDYRGHGILDVTIDNVFYHLKPDMYEVFYEKSLLSRPFQKVVTIVPESKQFFKEEKYYLGTIRCTKEKAPLVRFLEKNGIGPYLIEIDNTIKISHKEDYIIL